MPTRDRVVPIAASATVLVCAPLLPSASSAGLRLPITQAQTVRVIEREASVNRHVLPVRSDTHVSSARHDVFTAADMAVLDAIDGVEVVDDFDYSALLEYDDD